MNSKSQQYIARLLHERPKCTRSGVPITIVHDQRGTYVYTFSGRSRNGSHSVYMPCDFPELFGWERPEKQTIKPPLLITHKNYKYIRVHHA